MMGSLSNDVNDCNIKARPLFAQNPLPSINNNQDFHKSCNYKICWASSECHQGRMGKMWILIFLIPWN